MLKAQRKCLLRRVVRLHGGGGGGSDGGKCNGVRKKRWLAHWVSILLEAIIPSFCALCVNVKL